MHGASTGDRAQAGLTYRHLAPFAGRHTIGIGPAPAEALSVRGGTTGAPASRIARSIAAIAVRVAATGMRASGSGAPSGESTNTATAPIRMLVNGVPDGLELRDASLIQTRQTATQTDQPTTPAIDNLVLDVNGASGTVQVRAVFDNPGDRLMPGQFARIRLGQAKTTSAVVVPEL